MNHFGRITQIVPSYSQFHSPTEYTGYWIRTSSASSAVGFPDSLEDNWQTNDCVPIWFSVFPKKQATPVGFGSSSNDRTTVYFWARKSPIHYLSWYHRCVSKHRDRVLWAFLSANGQEPFFELLTNCVANKLFKQSNVDIILNVCWFH